MDLANILTLIGIIIAIITPIVVYRYENSKTRIFFFTKQFVQLYNDVLKNIPDLNITYKGEPVQGKMFVLKGVFVCSGKKDIVATDIDKGITLEITGEDANWLNWQITKSKNNLKIDLAKENKKTLIADFSLLKSNDYFVIEALGESDKVSVVTDHRISNVPNIIENVIGIEKTSKSRMIISALAFVVVLFIMSWTIGDFQKQYYLHSTYYNKSMDTVNQFSVVDTVLADGLTESEKSFFHKHLDTSAEVRQMSDSEKGRFYIKADSLYGNMLHKKGEVITEITWLKEDSTRRLAKKEYSNFYLMFRDSSRLYPLSSNFSVRYHLPIDWPFIVILLLQVLFGIYLIRTMIRSGLIFYQYRKVAGLAASLLN